MNESYHRTVNNNANKDLLFTVSMRARVHLSVIDWSERVDEVSKELGMNLKERREKLKAAFNDGGRVAFEEEQGRIRKAVAKIIDKRGHRWRIDLKRRALGKFDFTKEEAVKTLKECRLVGEDIDSNVSKESYSSERKEFERVFASIDKIKKMTERVTKRAP